MKKNTSRYIPQTETIYKLEDLFSDVEIENKYPRNSYDGGDFFWVGGLDNDGWTYGRPCSMVKDFCCEYSIYAYSPANISFEVIEQGEGKDIEYVLFMRYSKIIGNWAICYVKKPILKPKTKQIKSKLDPIAESISTLIVNGTRLELPEGQMKNYTQVKNVIQKAGGKYSKNGFEFNKDAKTIKNRLVSGEKLNDKKKFQFFETPQKLVLKLIEKANLKPSHKVLEPSAGNGAIFDHFLDNGIQNVAIELNPDCIKTLRDKYPNEAIREDNFLNVKAKSFESFDRIVMNPPFTKNQDVDHIKHAYDFLKNGGRLVSVAGLSWKTGSQKKQIAFRKWLKENNAEIEELDAGEFKESGTNVKTCIITINK